eukprot:352483-Chlamydomonas_euryale.AAC.12
MDLLVELEGVQRKETRHDVEDIGKLTWAAKILETGRFIVKYVRRGSKKELLSPGESPAVTHALGLSN